MVRFSIPCSVVSTPSPKGWAAATQAGVNTVPAYSPQGIRPPTMGSMLTATVVGINSSRDLRLAFVLFWLSTLGPLASIQVG
jgi:hypothetical protein